MKTYISCWQIFFPATGSSLVSLSAYMFMPCACPTQKNTRQGYLTSFFHWSMHTALNLAVPPEVMDTSGSNQQFLFTLEQI